MKKILTVITILLICMSMVSAVWWNPFTWFDEQTEQTYTTDELNLQNDQLLNEGYLDTETKEYVELKSLADPESYASETLNGLFHEYKTEYYLDNETRQEIRQKLVNNTYQKEYWNDLTNETYYQEYQKEEYVNYTVDITEQKQKSKTYTYKRYNNNTLRNEELNDAARFYRDNEYLENLTSLLPANTVLIGNRVYGLTYVNEWETQINSNTYTIQLNQTHTKEVTELTPVRVFIPKPYIIKYDASLKDGQLQLLPLEKWVVADFYNDDMDANSNTYRYSVLKALGLE